MQQLDNYRRRICHGILREAFDRIARRCAWKAALPSDGFVSEGTINHSLAVDIVVEAVQMDQKEPAGTYLNPLKERQVKLLAE